LSVSFAVTVLPVLAAPFLGSFAGVLGRRLPAGRPVGWARSECDACGATLGPAELVPIISYALQHGRCRRCGAPIGRDLLAIEIAFAGIALWAVIYADPAGIWADCVLGWTLLTLAWIDWSFLLLPDVLTLPLTLAGLLATALLDPDALTDHGIAAGLGWLTLASVAAAYQRLRGRVGLGGGDAKLMAAAGAWTGLEGLGPILLVGACCGIAVALARTRFRPGMATVVPFGTCLALGIWLQRLYG